MAARNCNFVRYVATLTLCCSSFCVFLYMCRLLEKQTY